MTHKYNFFIFIFHFFLLHFFSLLLGSISLQQRSPAMYMHFEILLNFLFCSDFIVILRHNTTQCTYVYQTFASSSSRNNIQYLYLCFLCFQKFLCIVSKPNSFEPTYIISHTHNHLYTLYVVLAITYLIKYSLSHGIQMCGSFQLNKKKEGKKYLWKTYSRILCDAVVYL